MIIASIKAPTPTPIPIFAPSDIPVDGVGAGLDELVGGTIIVRVDGAGVTDSEGGDTVVVVGVKFGFSNFNMSMSVLCHRTWTL